MVIRLLGVLISFRLVVVLRSKIFVYTLGPNPTKLLSFDTADNDEGKFNP